MYGEIKAEIARIKSNYIGNGSLPKRIVTLVTTSLNNQYGFGSRTCASYMRSLLEEKLTCFWSSKGKDFTNTTSLADMMDRKILSTYFSTLTISDLNNIRIACNDAIHVNRETKLPKIILSEVDVEEMLPRLERCLISIQSAINVKRNSPTAEKGSSEYEASLFFNKLQELLNESEPSIKCEVKGASAAINKKSNKVWLALDFLVKKEFLRIAIYIPDDTKTHYYDKLLAHREEIEKKLGFAPTWLDKGEKSDKTRWIKSENHKFTPYDRLDYERLASKALPVIKKYAKVFSTYLPEAFK